MPTPAPVVQSSSRLEINFAPRPYDRFWSGFLLFLGVVWLAMGAAGIAGVAGVPGPWMAHQENPLDCSRVAGTCTTLQNELIGPPTTITYHLERLSKSRVEKLRADDDQWVWRVADSSYGDLTLAGFYTSESIERYRHIAAEFQAFLDDPGRGTWHLDYPKVNAGFDPANWFIPVLGVLVTYWALHWIRGWRARLVFDREAGTLTITRTPTLWLGPASRVIPLARLASVGVVTSTVWMGYSAVPRAVVSITGIDGHSLFEYGLLLDPRARGPLQERLAAIQQFVPGLGLPGLRPRERLSPEVPAPRQAAAATETQIGIDLGPSLGDRFGATVLLVTGGLLLVGVVDLLRDNGWSHFAGAGGRSNLFAAGIAAYLFAHGLGWIRGWRARLEFDRGQNQLTIDQHPTLGFAPRRRTIPLRDVAAVHSTVYSPLSGFGLVKRIRVALVDPRGQALFAHSAWLGSRSRERIADRVREIENFLLHAPA